MKTDLPVAVSVRPPCRDMLDVVLGALACEIEVPRLFGTYRELVVLNLHGQEYRIRGEEPGLPLYLEIAENVDAFTHLRFIPDALDNPIPSENSRRLLAQEHLNVSLRFDAKWQKKSGKPLRPIDKMRLRDTPQYEQQIENQLPFLDDLVLIGNTLHRRIDQPLILVGDFDGGWDLAFGWDERWPGSSLCYAISEVDLAIKAARKLSPYFDTRYDNSLRNLVVASELDLDTIEYRYGLYCESFCKAVKHVRGYAIDGAMSFVQTLTAENRIQLLEIADLAERTNKNESGDEFIGCGLTLMDLTEEMPLFDMFKDRRLQMLTDILRSEGMPAISIDIPGVHF